MKAKIWPRQAQETFFSEISSLEKKINDKNHDVARIKPTKPC